MSEENLSGILLCEGPVTFNLVAEFGDAADLIKGESATSDERRAADEIGAVANGLPRRFGQTRADVDPVRRLHERELRRLAGEMDGLALDIAELRNKLAYAEDTFRAHEALARALIAAMGLQEGTTANAVRAAAGLPTLPAQEFTENFLAKES